MTVLLILVITIFISVCGIDAAPSVSSATTWKESSSRWVDIWTSMPQLTEPANLPPVPFVGYLGKAIHCNPDETIE